MPAPIEIDDVDALQPDGARAPGGSREHVLHAHGGARACLRTRPPLGKRSADADAFRAREAVRELEERFEHLESEWKRQKKETAELLASICAKLGEDGTRR